MRVGGLTVTTVLTKAWDGSAWQNLRVDPNSHLLVNIGGRSALAVNHVNITASAAQIIAANTSRKSLCIKNMGVNDVAIGPSGVTFATGFVLKPGEALSDIRTTVAIYGICNTGLTSTVCFWEE